MLAAACSSDDGVVNSGTNPGGGRPVTSLHLNEVSHGFGQILPHLVFRPGTSEIVAIRTAADISQNVYRGNAILPTVQLPPDAIGPGGTPGNHYLFANFTEALDPLDVIDPANAGGMGNGLSGAVTLTAIDTVTGATSAVPGRAFVGGQTVVLEGGQPVLQTWATFDSATGRIVPNSAIPEAQGFPGATGQIPNAETLVSPNTILFVADDDSDLTSFETFPSGVTIRFRATTALQTSNGTPLEDQVLAAVTVGPDLQTPELLFTPPPSSQPIISPGNGDINVSPETTIRVEFSEPVQPYSLGKIQGQGPALLSSAMEILFGPITGPITVPMNVKPMSPYDLSAYELIPAFAFPGKGSDPLISTEYSTVSIALSAMQVEDLSARDDPFNPGQPLRNLNALSAQTFFETGEGVGIVNVPVAPDVIFAGRRGSAPGMSVVDLNGFGQSTGNPVSSTPFPLEGESRFPYDPNILLNPGIRPLLSVGTSTVDGGSAGVFTLTRDSNLGDLVAAVPTLSDATDIHFAHALDSVFRNAPPPFGCQAGGGNVCALDGLKVIGYELEPSQPNTLQPAFPTSFGGPLPVGYENIISWAPHPNPPGLAFPPQCVSPFLGASEPTSIDMLAGSVQNLLVTGNPFPDLTLGSPPTGLLTLEQNQFFVGPSFGQVDPLSCRDYMMREQIGHFLYVLDRPRGEIVVFNSNRMFVLDRLPVADPVSMAIGPNLDLLAVSNQLADTVTFIDINPTSATFHTVVAAVGVGDSPRGLAFDPTNEDLIVCNELEGSLSILSVSNLTVRRTVTSLLERPFELAVTPRMTSFSFERGVYFGFILDRNDTCAVFESGPNGVNGWGFDDILGTLPFDFLAPKAIQVDPNSLNASVYIAHEGPISLVTGAAGALGDGAISRVFLDDATIGTVPLATPGGTVPSPSFRDLQFDVSLSLGQSSGALSGIPIDLAFDNQRNLGGTTGPRSVFSAGLPLPANSKATVRIDTQLGMISRRTSTPRFLFAAIPGPADAGVIDVLQVEAAGAPLFDVNPYVTGVQSISAPRVSVLCDYFRQ